MGDIFTPTSRVRALAGCGVAVIAIAAAMPVAAQAEVRRFDVPAQDAVAGISAFARQAGIQIAAEPASVKGRRTRPVRGTMPIDAALRQLLQGTGLEAAPTPGAANAIVIRPIALSAMAITGAAAADPPPAASPNDIIVTAQKRRESIQDVPIAISAFTQETLDKQKIEGGPDLLKAVPNLTFSKSNFAGYNLEIRGIGTKSVSVTSDAGVAVNFNSTTLITNRFFEQEFFDLERVEVLRGPQGTLYGRNATGGVVNIISAKPDLTKFDGYIKSEVGNFQSRRAQGAITSRSSPTCSASAWLAHIRTATASRPTISRCTGSMAATSTPPASPPASSRRAGCDQILSGSASAKTTTVPELPSSSAIAIQDSYQGSEIVTRAACQR